MSFLDSSSEMITCLDLVATGVPILIQATDSLFRTPVTSPGYIIFCLLKKNW
jgi:hypothetical protein